ncbi:hypothetical protein LCGC14_2447940 [marine sediment metagenome]|uniref:Uncharacterized protein n=1 Tax=marine sediment metagenome TaxID=412755 RepID=A0A0F9BH45_9ZZZZ
MPTVGQFKYRLALDPRLLARIIDESGSVHEKLEALRKWATYANKRMTQIAAAPETAWYILMDGTEAAFLIDRTLKTKYGPFPKPVCGSYNQRDGLLCLFPRGNGTQHPGKGPCYTCEMKSSSALQRSGAIYKPGNEKMLALNRANNLPARLRECLDVTEKMETKALRNIETDIKTSYAMVQFILEGGLHNLTEEQREKGEWLTAEDIKTCNTLLKTVLEAKKVGYLMEKDAKLDPVTIKAFVGQVMSVVFSNVEPNTARRISGEILDQVIRPFKMEGRLSGSDADYEGMGDGMKKAVAKFAGIAKDEVEMESEGNGKTLTREEVEESAKEGMKKIRGVRQDLEKKTKTSLTGQTFEEIRKKEKAALKKARSTRNKTRSKTKV